MSEFMERVRAARAEQARKRRRMALKGLAIAGLLLVSAWALGASESHQRLVETTYTVKEGDTLWAISEEYMAKNTGSRRYILEFKEGIKELNPWLLESHEQIQVGQVLRINYFVKDEGGENE